MSLALSERNERIDLFRGLALLVLISDHLPGNPLRTVTPVSWGLADMAEAFVLVSGVVWGMTLSRRRNTDSQSPTTGLRMRRRLRRVVVIYAAYCMTSVLVVSLVRAIQSGGVAATLPPHLLANPWSSVLFDIATFNGRVTHLCILLLYFWLALGMLVVPVRAWHSPRLLLLCSMLMYVASQLFAEVALPDQWQWATNYNPFAWQFLFVTGAVFALVPEEFRQRNLSHPRMIGGAVIVQGTLLLMVGMELPIPGEFTQKSSLGPLRYLHAVSGALILWAFVPVRLPPQVPGWKRGLMQGVRLCGEQAIWVYCGGTLLAILLADWSLRVSSPSEVILVNSLAWLGCIAIAILAQWIKTVLRGSTPVSTVSTSAAHSSEIGEEVCEG